jgi:hypothetical protein
MRLRLSLRESESVSRSHQGLRLLGGDQILLTSDGLTDLATDAEIQQALTTLPPQEAVDSLVQLARTRGGHDNITVVLLTVPTRAPVRRTRSRFYLATALAVLALLALLALAAAAAWWFGLWPWSLERVRQAEPPDLVAPVEGSFAPGATSLAQPIPGLPQGSPTPTFPPAPTSTAFPLPTVPPPSP